MIDSGFQFWPARASTSANQVDFLTWFLLTVSGVMTLLICVVIVYFCVKYRRRSPATPPALPSPLWMEITWSVVPLGIMMVMFFAGAYVYVRIFRPPPDSMLINVIGKQWMWKTEHPEGAREINELHVPAGQNVQLLMISQDVIHSFFIPAFRLHQDVLPGRYTTLWFHATTPGEYHIFCSQFCGTEHSKMVGRVVVMQPADYQQWLAGAVRSDPDKVAGEKLFSAYGCISCHGVRGPTLAGVYGRRVELQDGSTVLADENYLRESIINPSAKIVRGFPEIMPTYKGQLTEEQLVQLIAYIKSLSGAADTGPYQLPDIGSPTTQPSRDVPGPWPFLPNSLPGPYVPYFYGKLQKQ
jgi:cytochrome c oxidase subunit 2